MRVVSLIVALLFALGGARVGWSCPTAGAEPGAGSGHGCCCDEAAAADQADAERDDGPRFERACCCVAKTAGDARSSAPSAEPPSRDRLARGLVASVPPAIAPAAPLTLAVAPVVERRGPPPETLFLLHTLLLS